MEEKKNLEEMNYKKLNDDYLDKITGGIAPGPPVPWICPYCARHSHIGFCTYENRL